MSFYICVYITYWRHLVLGVYLTIELCDFQARKYAMKYLRLVDL